MGECFREIAGPGLAGRKLCGSLLSWLHTFCSSGSGQQQQEALFLLTEHQIKGWVKIPTKSCQKIQCFSGSVSPLSCILSISFLSLRVCMGTQLSVVSAFNEHFLVMGSDRPSAVFRTLEWKQKNRSCTEKNRS